MRPRDRLVLALIAVLLVAGGMWLVLVAPERNQVSSLSAQITSERSALTAAEGQLNQARDAVAAYVGHVHQIDAVVQAVPTSPAEADLMKTITRLAGTSVDFRELDVGSQTGSAPGPVALGLTFDFDSNYGNLQSFLNAVDALTSTNASGTQLDSDGRLFTIQSVALAPDPPDKTKATIIAQVYVQNPATGATGATGSTGATP
jgi:hypothetical protein